MTKFLISPPKWVGKVLFLFLALATLILYTHLGRDPLFDWDEGIYAALGKELLRSGNLFVNTWNGEVWFEKPPGISWLSGLGQLLGGQTSFGSRLLQPAVTTLVLYVLFLLGTKLKNWRVGLMSAGFLLGFNLFLGRARAVNTDMPLLLGIVTSFYLILSQKKPWQVALVIAGSVWFKGLAGFLPALIAAPLFLTLPKKYFLQFTLYSILFILPWHLYAYLVYGQEFVTPYFLEQVVRRATVPIEFHLESRWFYFSYLYENLGLGRLFALVLGLSVVAYRFFKSRSLSLFTLLWWFFFPLALFTVSKTRLFWYILPVYPAIALILAYLLESFGTTKTAQRVLTVLTLGILAQGLWSAGISVELARPRAVLPNRLATVTVLKSVGQSLAVLVPPEERIAEAVLPLDQRISSSFRYGGTPSVVYYFDGPVRYFYNVDEFNAYWSQEGDVALIAVGDHSLVPVGEVVTGNESFLGLKRNEAN